MHLQLWSLGHGTTLWRAAPGLYYRMVGELINRSIAAHGPPIKSDFDVKLVGDCSEVLNSYLRLTLKQPRRCLRRGPCSGATAELTAVLPAATCDCMLCFLQPAREHHPRRATSYLAAAPGAQMLSFEFEAQA